ncbi:MAG: aspartyl-tRNA(Asn)/glutamyl-tRNA(Gln) amidotransferase subunit [Actinomycetota bacterium]|nr:aspartyl-tRNA(Asn)/glutamyl-tRNA(Gln) amidotransferase subunit [Actinomycetota bacterium]
MPHEHLTTGDVAHLAHLARIDLPADSLPHYAAQLDAILDAVSRVGEVAADDVPPMSHPQDIANVTRPDAVRPGISREQALAGAPSVEDDRFRVPRILEEAE